MHAGRWNARTARTALLRIPARGRRGSGSWQLERGNPSATLRWTTTSSRPGRIQRFSPPSGPGVRIDSGVETGSVVAGQFDSMMAKLIVHGDSREQVLMRARRALAEFEIEGVPSVLPFHRAVLEAAASVAVGHGGFHVHARWIGPGFADLLHASLAPAPRGALDPLRLPRAVVGGRRLPGRRARHRGALGALW